MSSEPPTPWMKNRATSWCVPLQEDIFLSQSITTVRFGFRLRFLGCDWSVCPAAGASPPAPVSGVPSFPAVTESDLASGMMTGGEELPQSVSSTSTVLLGSVSPFWQFFSSALALSPKFSMNSCPLRYIVIFRLQLTLPPCPVGSSTTGRSGMICRTRRTRPGFTSTNS